MAKTSWVISSDADLSKKIIVKTRHLHVNINVNSTIADRRNGS